MLYLGNVLYGLASGGIMRPMDLEQLTKTQIVLLTLFVSFVTSIATGIVTITLMDQAPSDVTRTIDRVIEKTVERVVPGETKVVERIKEVSNPTSSDLAINTVEKTKEILVYVKTGDGSESRGFTVSAQGDAVIMQIPDMKEGNEVVLTRPGSTGTSTLLAIVKKLSNNNLALVSLKDSPKTPLPHVNLAQATIPAVGQQVLSIGYSRALGVNVEFGNVTALLDKEADEGQKRFLTSLSADSGHVGSPIVDVTARVLGIEFGATEGMKGSVVLPLPAIDAL